MQFILKGKGFYSKDSQREEEMKKIDERENRMQVRLNKEEHGGKRMECMHDLTRGERQYLARKGITGREFDNMTTRQQREWKEEMKRGSYASNDRRMGTVNKRFQY